MYLQGLYSYLERAVLLELCAIDFVDVVGFGTIGNGAAFDVLVSFAAVSGQGGGGGFVDGLTPFNGMINRADTKEPAGSKFLKLVAEVSEQSIGIGVFGFVMVQFFELIFKGPQALQVVAVLGSVEA
jgi:hypothetical protein